MLINELEMNKTLDTETLRSVRGGVGGSNTIGFGSTFTDSGLTDTSASDSKSRSLNQQLLVIAISNWADRWT
jgi:hypothetical protein